MTNKDLQDILPFVEKPSRYLGSEVNRVVKDPAAVRLHIALAYPDLYEIGTSHFGVQILYDILNRIPEVHAQRVFAPGMDMARRLRADGLPLTSLETHRDLKRFDMIGFSLLYELNYTNVLLMLSLAQIPFLAARRDASHPLVIAGGPCTVNPEPVAPFFDAMVVGDGEDVIVRMAREQIRWKQDGARDRDRLLAEWSKIEGVYIPTLFHPAWDAAGFQILSAAPGGARSIRRAVVPDLDAAPFPATPVVPHGRPIHDRLRLEVARGCTRGCRFCQAGMIYRPVRERSPETLIRLFETAIRTTGYEDLSLLSLSTGDYGCITSLLAQLMSRCGGRHVAVSLPSLRAGTLTPEMMRLIRQVRKTGFTIAPEAGSQRLRDVINKDIRAEDIEATVADAFDLGWKVIKLYFMVGLPTETDADVAAIADLVDGLRSVIRKKSRGGNLNVSVAGFVPKPHTPFQWASQDDLRTAQEKILWLRSRLKHPGIRVKWQDPRVSRLEGLWSRGDRRLAPLLVEAYEKGCVFDGWSDRFSYDRWMTAVADSGVDVDFYTTRQRTLEEPLPWDHVDTGVSAAYLRQEWQNALTGGFTPDCRNGACNGCGVCDFVHVEPRVFKDCPDIPRSGTDPVCAGQDPDRRLEVGFVKLGTARFFGHLEMVSIFTRALRRMGLAVKFSAGFHPKPKIVFADTLPIGMESEQEVMWLTVTSAVHPDDFVRDLNRHLPEGLRVTDCKVMTSEGKTKTTAETTYRVTLKDGIIDEARMQRFLQETEWIVQRENRKGRVTSIDLRKAVRTARTIARNTLRLTLSETDGVTVRPAEVLSRVLELSDRQCKTATIVKEIGAVS